MVVSTKRPHKDRMECLTVLFVLAQLKGFFSVAKDKDGVTFDSIN